MASNEPIASRARKPALSVEDAERFASQIRPSWELLGPDASAADFGLDDAPGVAAPAAGSGARGSDTIIEGVRPIVIAGSDETVLSEESWDTNEAAAPVKSEPEAPPIEAKVIASIGISSKPDVPVNELPLPPQVGHPMVPTPGAPIAPVPAAKTKLGVGGTSGESAPMAKAKPTRAPASTASTAPASTSAKAAAAPVSAKATAAPTAGPASVSRSRPGATNPGAVAVPVDTDANDDIEIPISGAPKGLLLKIGGGIAAVAAILLAVKLFGGSGATEPSKAPITATAAATTPPPSLPTAAPEPPKATGQASVATAAPTVAATAAPTVAATAAPTVKEKPVVAKVEPPPPAVVVKKVATPPPAGGTPPPVVVKKGGGIIRETPF